jgi:pimeloyl-ACP methyl ester carboxylesterase
MNTHLAFGGGVVALLLAATLGGQEQPPRADDGLELAPCLVTRGEGAECGRILVPEDRTNPAGRRIGVRFVVVRASTPGARRALFMFAGGPGQGGTAMAGQAFGWANPIRSDQDVVLVDQRGTGQSNPLACRPHATADPAAAFGHVFDPGWIAECRAELSGRADLSQYTTDAAVEDVEAIRVRLGYGKIALIGVSYGTRMAQAYLRRHPDRVSAVVLDGVVPFDLVVPLTYARNAQQALDRVLAACRADEACHAAHPNVAQAAAAVMKLVSAGPVKATVRTGAGARAPVRISAGDLGYAVRGIMYAGGNAVRDLADLFARAAAGGDLSEFAQRYYDREVRMEGALAMGLHLSVFCAEDIPFADAASVGPATSGTFLGRYLFDDYRRVCALWPKGTVASDARTPVSARVPVLLVSGALDPVTPPEFAERVARSLPLSRVIVVPGGGHGSATGCPRPAVLHLLAKGTFDGIPAVCR